MVQFYQLVDSSGPPHVGGDVDPDRSPSASRSVFCRRGLWVPRSRVPSDRSLPGRCEHVDLFGSYVDTNSSGLLVDPYRLENGLHQLGAEWSHDK